MPGEVIERVHVLSQRNPAGSDIVFGWRNGQAIDDELDDPDDLHDKDYVPGQDGSDDDTDDNNSYTDDDASQASVPPPVAGVNDENNNNENTEEATESESKYADDHDEYVPGEVTDEDTDEEHIKG
jgi:hypothetical protein